MTKTVLALLFAAGLAAAPACASAPAGGGQGQMPRLSAGDTLAMCLHRHDAIDARHACIGEYARACMTLSEGGETTSGMIRCYDEERAVWDARLDAAYAALQGGLPDVAVTALRDAQRAWIVLRDADCAFRASLNAGGSLAGVEAAVCLMLETAERTLVLQRWQREESAN